ncbi:MAG TPA: hypothetical protein VFL04_06085 [Rectinemataceae bacterium]|nr:hypothetical protein [Rectinemataceae bacterium]
MSPEPGSERQGPAAAVQRAAELCSFAQDLAARPRLPARSELSPQVEFVLGLLKAEDPGLRPRDSGGLPGGLVRLPAHPVVLVPDLHARPLLLAKVLAWRPDIGGDARAPTGGPGQIRERASVAELLAMGEASLVCLGDAFHSEAGGAARRWRLAYREYLSSWASHGAMDEEMALTLSTIRIILAAKAAFPRNFHYIKGNHDNLANEDRHGDRSFYKFAAEGEMVASWFTGTYGRALLEAYRSLELELPLAVLGELLVASHGEPAFAMGPGDIIEYRRREDVVYGLIWTGNDEAEAGSVQRSLAALLGPSSGGARWFGGHRPVRGRYALRAGGSYVQFHDPSAHQVALILPGRPPDPERDIRILG